VILYRIVSCPLWLYRAITTNYGIKIYLKHFPKRCKAVSGSIKATDVI